MPFEVGTSRNRFGTQRGWNHYPIPLSERPVGWDAVQEGADVPARPVFSDIPPPPSSSKRGLLVGAALGLPIIGIAVAQLATRYHQTTQGCVDKDTGLVVAESYCQTTSSGSHYWHHYGGSYRMGFPPSGGSFTAPSGTTRGGFGSVGSFFSGGS